MINLVGQVNDEMLKDFMNQLENEVSDEVEVRISSDGGLPYVALAIAGIMRSSGQRFTVTGYGRVMSAATLILAAGHKRLLQKYTWVMVHQDMMEIEGETSQVRASLKQTMREAIEWCQLFEDFTGTPRNTWLKLEKKTTYLTPEECQKLGLINGVI